MFSVSLIISVPVTKTPWEKIFHPVDAENLVGEPPVGNVNDSVHSSGDYFASNVLTFPYIVPTSVR